MLFVGALDPRMFNDAIVMFALFLGDSVWFIGPGVGRVRWSLVVCSHILAGGVPDL